MRIWGGLIGTASFLTVAAAVCTVPAAVTDLSFERRVQAQEAIERIAWSHQIGSRMPFEQAVPRALLEEKVRVYLRQSAALERFWDAPITAEALRAEALRIAQSTRMPERLTELYRALDDDPRLILECLVRPVLAERLIRERFESDPIIDTDAGRGAHRGWDAWWDTVRGDLDYEGVVPVAAEDEMFLPRSSSLLPSTCPQWDNGILDDYTESATYRLEHTAVWTGAVVIVWGGANPRGGRYDPVTDTWSNMSIEGSPEPRNGHTAVWTGSEMLVWGGWFGGGPGQARGTGGRYDPVSDTWGPMTTTGAPSPRFEHTAVWTGEKMIVWGGFNSTSFLGDGAAYDPATDRWDPIASSGAPTLREEHTAVWTGEKMIIWGGWSAPNYLNTGGQYDPITDSWSATTTFNAPTARGSHTAVWTGSSMIVYGGNGGSQFKLGGRYDPINNSWQPANVVGDRTDHTAVWTGTRMLVWGGRGHDYSCSPALYCVVAPGISYDPVSDTAMSLPVAGAPSPRYYHAAVWAGDVMFVHGGTGGGDYGRYSPSQGTWLPSAAPTEPRGRVGHTAVWTGSLMLVWGGEDNGAVLNSGFRYDPVLDTVTPTATLNAPPPMSRHSAVWTGSEMIVWRGGGGRYDPVGDSWTSVSATGAPSIRSGHSAIWSGSEMLVWGGQYTYACTLGTCTGSLADGGRYNPSTDTWQGISSSGAPSHRVSHTGVWTGDRMLIWGGYSWGCTPAWGCETQPEGPGALFDPVTGAWSPMSTTGSPSPRLGHSAAWTGSSLLVWGGRQSFYSQTLGDGGQYTPATNLWSPINLVGAPSPRSDATTVWTGDSMLLWGGRDDHNNVAPGGGAYNPQTATWSLINDLNAPELRSAHTAVWTGSSYVVWGGSGQFGRLKSGGRLNWVVADGDGDGVALCGEPADCDDDIAGVWSTPGETRDLSVSKVAAVAWNAPLNPGGVVPVYDLLRASAPSGFSNAVCLQSDGAGTSVVDSAVPAPGSVFYYLSRADNACAGMGTLGSGSSGSPRLGRDCP